MKKVADLKLGVSYVMFFQKYKLIAISETAIKSTTEKHSQELKERDRRAFNTGDELISYIAGEVGDYYILKWPRVEGNLMGRNLKYAYKPHWKTELYFSNVIDPEDRKMFRRFRITGLAS